MSKAFTRESDDLEAEVTALRPRPASGGRNYMTRQGADRLREELARLAEQRSDLLKENGEEAKASLRRVEASLAQLQARLDAVVIADLPADREKAGFGAFVSVRYPDGEKETFQIVGIDEASPEQGRISAASPLAQALLNRRAGERVEFRSPAGRRMIVIESVKYL